MSAVASFEDMLSDFLRKARALRSEEEEKEEPVAQDDPQRDPNWCWMHNMLWPACAGMH